MDPITVFTLLATFFMQIWGGDEGCRGRAIGVAMDLWKKATQCLLKNGLPFSQATLVAGIPIISILHINSVRLLGPRPAHICQAIG
jgi:hypothetical protein